MARRINDVPGKSVKNWRKYEALRRKGLSKSMAAKIANTKRRKRKR